MRTRFGHPAESTRDRAYASTPISPARQCAISTRSPAFVKSLVPRHLHLSHVHATFGADSEAARSFQ